LSKRYALAEPRAATAPGAAVAISKLPHLSRFLLEAKNSAKCSRRPDPDEHYASSGCAVLATHRTHYLRPPQLSHFLLEARKSANCSRHPEPDGKSANKLAFLCDLPQLSRNLLEAKFPASCCWLCNPHGKSATRVALLAIYRTCHRKCKYGEHFLRHVLVTPSAHNHIATKQSPSHKTPRCHRICLKPDSPPTPLSGARKLVLPTGTAAHSSAPFTPYLHSRDRQMPPRSCPCL